MSITANRLRRAPVRRLLYGSLIAGAAKGEGGSLYVTYHGWPLYTYAGDSAPGQAHGQGITSFGGTWYPLSPSGSPVTSTSHPGSSPSASSGGGGYGY